MECYFLGYIIIRCQGGEVVGLGWLLWVGGLVKIRARGKDQTKGTYI